MIIFIKLNYILSLISLLFFKTIYLHINQTSLCIKSYNFLYPDKKDNLQSKKSPENKRFYNQKICQLAFKLEPKYKCFKIFLKSDICLVNNIKIKTGRSLFVFSCFFIFRSSENKRLLSRLSMVECSFLTFGLIVLM